MKIRTNSGFTLVELLVAVALGLVILAGLFQTFRTQHDTYIVQDQMAAMQQNLRAAMYLITRDLQMTGWYTSRDKTVRTFDLDDLGSRSGRPLIFSEDNSDGAGGAIKVGTDALVIFKAADETGHTISSDLDTASGSTISSNILTLSGLGADNPYGLLVKNDLRAADVFDATNPALTGTYQGNSDDPFKADMVFRTDIIIYKVMNHDDGRPRLYRRNLGNDNGYQPVAENIDNMQVRYQLSDESWVDSLTPATQVEVRAVEVILVGRTALQQKAYTDTNTYDFANNPEPHLNPNDEYRRRVLRTIVKTRNVGL